MQGLGTVGNNTGMRILTSSLLISLLAWGGSASAQATDKPSLTGTWQYQPRGTTCAEQYYFRSDGTMMVTSGKEVTESTYLRLQGNGERLILCRDANLATCMGPLIRLKGRIGA